MKKFLVLLPIILTGCASAPQKTQCDPEKNYRYINDVLINDYKEKFVNKKIKSIYYDYSNLKINDNSFKYNNDTFDFIEKKIKLDNEEKFSIVKIESFNIKNMECNNIIKKDDNYCYKIYKQENIESNYGLILESNDNTTHVKFNNLETNQIVYEYSYTIYTTGAIGGPGYGMCPPSKENNSLNHKVNLIGFPSNPLNIPYKIKIGK